MLQPRADSNGLLPRSERGSCVSETNDCFNAPAMPARRFPPPWSIEELNDACFVVRPGEFEATLRSEVNLRDALNKGLCVEANEVDWEDSPVVETNCKQGRRYAPFRLHRHWRSGRIAWGRGDGFPQSPITIHGWRRHPDFKLSCDNRHSASRDQVLRYHCTVVSHGRCGFSLT